MKTRNSLISNSSSASFICTRSIKEIALDMWKVVMDESRDYDGKKTYSRGHNLILSKIKKALKKPEVLNGTIGICFPSCNEDTYIIVKDGACWIATCWNHDWNNIDGLCPQNEGIVENKIENDFFLMMEGNSVISYKTYTDNIEDFECKKCKHPEDLWAYHIDRDGNKYCSWKHHKLTKKK